jgi:rhodanese-related sulfurtransferase
MKTFLPFIQEEGNPRDYSLRPRMNRSNLLGMTLLAQENLTQSSMEELLTRFPGARRTLFQLHHIGGCSSCGFALTETLSQICQRNGGLDPESVLNEIQAGHEQDEKLLISPADLRSRLTDATLKLLDIRTREEFEAVAIPGTEFMTQEIMQAAMNWPKETEIILIDHSGSRVLDAAAYFAGHGFTAVKGLKGGIDAYAATADTTLPRYTVEAS